MSELHPEEADARRILLSSEVALLMLPRDPEGMAHALAQLCDAHNGVVASVQAPEWVRRYSRQELSRVLARAMDSAHGNGRAVYGQQKERGSDRRWQ